MSELPIVYAKLLTANAEALDRAVKMTGLGRNDTVNRAIALYEAILWHCLVGEELLRFVDEKNQPVELVLPAGQQVLRTAVEQERRLRHLSNGVTIVACVALAAFVLVFWLAG
jgi:hypothetical protein